MGGVILWDFDETLAWRPGRWRGAMVDALDAVCPGHGISADSIGPLLRTGFPWHTPSVPHPELCAPRAWWVRMERLLASVFVAAGAPAARAADLARLAHERYVDPSTYRVYDDVPRALSRLSGAGFIHVALTNHVPELPAILRGLGLSERFAHVACSAETGYERPHAESYAIARRLAGTPSRLWMVGNSYESDVLGAESCGIPAILVRSSHPAARRVARDLDDVASLVIAEA